MKVEFRVSAGLHFREAEVVEYDDGTTEEQITTDCSNWCAEQVDGGWSKIDEVADD